MSLIDLLPKHLKIIRCADREAWLLERQKYICASEVAAVMGESTYHSRFSLYQVKMGLKQDPTVNSDYLEAGHRMEPVCAEWFSDVTGCPIEDPGAYTLIVNPEFPWLAATLDRLTLVPANEGDTLDESKTPAILELKNANAFKIKDWDEDVPLPFHFQSQTQMLCSGLDCGAVASIVGGCQFRYRFTNVYPELQELIIKDTREFWKRIQNGDAPDPDGHEATTKALKLMHPKDNGERVSLPASAREWMDEYDYCADKIKEWTEKQDAIKNHVKALIGDATVGFCPGGEWSWKHQGGKLKDVVEVPAAMATNLKSAGIPFKPLVTPESRVLRKKVIGK